MRAGTTRFALLGTALVLALGVASLAGCAQSENRNPTSGQQGVSDVLKEQASQAEADSESASQTSSSSSVASQASSSGSTGQSSSASAVASEFVGDAKSAYDTVDYDLSEMNSDMVYATVYDMMVNPATYEGKIVRMAGIYYSSYLEKTDTTYFFVIVKDAAACCSQGIEFVWGDGSHVYPQEYPEEGASVVVTGRFETYTEGSVNYERLANASLQAA